MSPLVQINIKYTPSFTSHFIEAMMRFSFEIPAISFLASEVRTFQMFWLSPCSTILLFFPHALELVIMKF